MSTVIIGGGNLKMAVNTAENASLNMTDAQRANLVALFQDCTTKILDFASNPQPPA